MKITIIILIILVFTGCALNNPLNYSDTGSWGNENLMLSFNKYSDKLTINLRDYDYYIRYKNIYVKLGRGYVKSFHIIRWNDSELFISFQDKAFLLERID